MELTSFLLQYDVRYMTLLVHFNEFMRCSFACAIKRLQWLVVSFAIFKLVLCRRTSDF